MKTNFWQTPVGKILGYGIHEHSSGIGLIKTSVALLKKMKENGNLTDDELTKYLDLIDKRSKKCVEAIDYIYTELKKLQENEKTT